jgi:hypothetical protein
MMSKGEKERSKEKDQKHEYRGSNHKERYPFQLMLKGERNMRRETSEEIDEEPWSHGGYECFQQFQRGRLLHSWLSFMSTNMVVIDVNICDGSILRSLQEAPEVWS